MKAKSTPSTSTSSNIPTWNRGGILELLSSLVLLGGPIFYVLGRVYLEGYWTALKVPPSLMAVDAEDYVYFGLAFVVNSLIMLIPRTGNAALWAAPLVSIFSLAALGLCVWIFGRIRTRIRPKLRKSLARLRIFCANKKSAVEALAASASIVNAVCSAMLAFLLASLAILLPLVLAATVGRFRAERVRMEVTTSISTYPQVVVDGAAAASGRLLECTEKYCVVYANGKFTPVDLGEVRWAQQAQSSSGESLD